MLCNCLCVCVRVPDNACASSTSFLKSETSGNPLKKYVKQIKKELLLLLAYTTQQQRERERECKRGNERERQSGTALLSHVCRFAAQVHKEMSSAANKN